MGEILRFEDLDYFYVNHQKQVDILKGAAYSFEQGKLYTVLGPSGSGKTTTLALAAALDVPKGGKVYFRIQTLDEIGLTRYRSSKIGIVFQSYNLLPYMNGLQNVMTAMEITENKIENKKERAYALLEKVGIDRDKARRNVNKLSGGEQQRIAIARAISTDAELILADEPTGNLDVDTAREIIGIFKSLAHDDGKCVIAVTHSIDFSEQADVVVRLAEGKLVS